MLMGLIGSATRMTPRLSPRSAAPDAGFFVSTTQSTPQAHGANTETEAANCCNEGTVVAGGLCYTIFMANQ